MSYVGYILAAILLLLLMITVHEFGHYIAGKIFGFGIEEFANLTKKMININLKTEEHHV